MSSRCCSPQETVLSPLIAGNESSFGTRPRNKSSVILRLKLWANRVFAFLPGTLPNIPSAAVNIATSSGKSSKKHQFQRSRPSSNIKMDAPYSWTSAPSSPPQPTITAHFPSLSTSFGRRVNRQPKQPVYAFISWVPPVSGEPMAAMCKAAYGDKPKCVPCLPFWRSTMDTPSIKKRYWNVFGRI